MDERLLESAKNGTRRTGQKDLVRHLEGKKITRQEAIQAKCYDCNGMGEADTCDSESCALYPYSQFRAKSKEVTGNAV